MRKIVRKTCHFSIFRYSAFDSKIPTVKKFRESVALHQRADNFRSMAFVIPNRPGVLHVLERIESEDYGNRGITNVTRRMTLGLASMYAEIRATKSFPRASFEHSSTFPTNKLGHLLVGNSAPVLLKRYRLAEIIAHGTFSQIFRAFDIFHMQYVAVKVMRIGYNMLGIKEFELLQFMATKTLRGCQSCEDHS